jgi:hypothetical protein
MKHLILSCLLIASASSVFSQRLIRLSFVGDPSVNWMRTSDSNTENGKSMLGYDFGLNADYYFSEDERYSLSTGVQISNTGGEISYHSSSAPTFAGTTFSSLITKVKYQIRYVEIPLALKLKTDQFNRAKYWGLFGLSAMVNIGSKGTSNDGALKKANINDEVNLFNLAMNVGIGFDYDLGGNNAVTTGLIFQNGLMDVTTDNAFSDKTIINSLKLKIGLIF